jgi:hypothetical protein
MMDYVKHRVHCWCPGTGIWVGPIGLAYHYEILPKSRVHEHELMAWADQNTTGNWAYDREGVNPLAWTFYFEHERDLVTFILRWA